MATGAIFVKISNSWSKQYEKIPVSQLRPGDNTVSFSVPAGCDYGYKVKNIRIRFDNQSNECRRIVINQPERKCYFKKFGYVGGYVSGNGSENAKVYANGKLIRSFNSVFEGCIEKNIEDQERWQAEIVAVFEDGETLKTEIDFREDGSYDYCGNYLNEVPHAEGRFTPLKNVNIGIPGFALTADSGCLVNPVVLSVSGLRTEDMALLDPSMVNVTGNSSGFRCLPHGNLFSREAEIRIKYDSLRIPKGYSPSDIRTYYYDETASAWIQLNYEKVDPITHEIVSRTDHFTDFVNAILKTPESPQTEAFVPTTFQGVKPADPLAGYNLIDAPTANSFGTVNLGFPIDLPAGRQGIEPVLNLNYSSDNGNGWLGMGWNLSIPAITVETRWGVPNYSPSVESESYLLNGEQLIPMVQRNEFEPRGTANTKVFTLRVEGSFEKIIRHGTLPTNYWWEVVDKQGVTYTYGKYNSDSGPNMNCILTDDLGIIAVWALADVRDLNGNFVKYDYAKTVNTTSGSPGCGGRQIYPESIQYTGHDNSPGLYKVEFILEPTARSDYFVSNRYGFPEYTDRLLQQVKVSYANKFIRTYIFKYKSGSFNKELICFIAELTDSVFIPNVLSANCSTDLGDFHGCKAHHFDYYTENQHSFSSPVNFATGMEDLELSILEDQISINNNPGLDKSLTTGWSVGGSLNLGLGANACSKSISLGGSYTYDASKTQNHVMLMDINGDGLPDRVYMQNGHVAFNKLKLENNQLSYDTQPQIIAGLPALGKSRDYSNTWGIEGQIGISQLYVAASASWTTTHNYNYAYFSDVNSDGYPDFIDDGKVYYNATNDISFPHFIEESTEEVQYLPGSPCNYIIRSGQVNDSVYTPIPPTEEDELYSYQRDAVRVWIAPYNGKITIDNKIQLIEDNSYSRSQSTSVDGIVFSLQKGSQVLKRDEIGPDNYDQMHWENQNISVQKGDRFYFRIQSKTDRKWDDVNWNPLIRYQQIGNKVTDTTVTDAEGKNIAVFQPSRDLLIYNQQEFIAPYSGKIRIKGSVHINQVSDSVYFKITKNSSSIRSSAFAANTQVNYYVDDTVNVALNDKISISAYTNTNIDWNKINNDLKIYYYQADSVAIDTNSNFNRIEVRPMVQYNLHQNTIFPSKATQLNAGSYTMTPYITASSNTNGFILLAAKCNNQVLGKKKIELQNGSIVGNPTISFNLPGTSTVFFDYYCDSLENNISGVSVDGNGYTIAAGLHAYIPESMWIFGNLYRGWGQFSYNDNDTNTYTPIDEADLHLSQLTTDTSLITFSTANINSFSSATNALSANGANDALHEPFSVMFPDLDSMMFRDYARYCHVGKFSLSNSILKSGTTSQDTTFDSPLIPNNNPNVPIRSVRKSSIQKNFAYSASASMGLSISYAHNNTKTQGDLDYFDMNGDGYPDIVGVENVQYSTPQGGLFDNVLGPLNGDLDNSEFVGEGISFGVNLPMAKHNNNPKANKGKSASTKSTGTGPNSGSNTANSPSAGTTTQSSPTSTDAGAGNASSAPANSHKLISRPDLFLSGSTYEGSSESGFALRDINGDGLPDKVFDNGNVNLNYGYRFGGDENWLMGDICSSQGVSEGLSMGGGMTMFNSNQYSWSGGVSMTLSSDKTSTEMIDMNNDGFLDIVIADGSDNTLQVILNDGHGFALANTTPWPGCDTTSFSKSTNGSVFLSGSAGITVLFFKIVINLQGGISGSVNSNKLMIMDFNNDGYPDIVTVNDDNSLNVRFSTLGKINILKNVVTPAKSSFSVEYTMTGCNQDMPQRHWVMSTLKVYDGFQGDGQDTIYQRFAYGKGYYDRYERQFYGFDSVITMQYDNFSASGTCYRSVIEKYHNRDFLFKGLKYYEAIVAGTTVKYIETKYTYNKKEISTGKVVPDSLAHCFGPYYPAISQEDKFYYDPAIQNTWQIHTMKKYSHGKYGNVVRFHDYGDVADDNDDVISIIHYAYDTTLNLLAMADSIVVIDTNSNLMRKRTADYNSIGQIAQLRAYSGNDIAVTSIDYDTYGNINSIQYPENSSAQRMSYTYTYDPALNTYPVSITDALGYASYADYDYRLGAPLSITDISGNVIQYAYYHDGKPYKITGPYEIEAGAPYTIKFEYSDESNSDSIWSITNSMNPQSFGFLGSYISVTVADGLGRILQTHKNIVENGVDKWLFTGKSTFDAYGRVINTSMPVSVPGNNFNYFKNIVTANNFTSTYDVLDRPLIQTAPDQTDIENTYAFANDDFGIKRFTTRIVDQNGNPTIAYTTPQGLKTMVVSALPTTTTFEYDPLGELLQSTDPDGNSTTYAYDQLGRMTQRVHPDAGTTTYSFDMSGNLVSTQTQNLAQNSQYITYEYDYNRLTRVIYPQNPENNVFYQYGEPPDGNQAGKITSMEDASGFQKFSYGKMGEVVENIHTFIVPSGYAYTFETNWEYDSWNRVQSITYPDGERVEYEYDNAGQLYKMSSAKGTDSYAMIDSILYDMYGSRSAIYYGNQTRAEYTYNPLNQRLENLSSFDGNNDLMQDIDYTYDDASNITAISNSAGYVNSTLGGNYSYSYGYDDLYRLTSAEGSFESYTDGTLPFVVGMTYSASGNIINKNVNAQTLIAGSQQQISYNGDYYYNDRPHTVTSVDNVDYQWDDNGNMTVRSDNITTFKRYLCWDEENRLAIVRNISEEPPSNLASYLYNAGGDRVWKLTGEVQTMYVNGQPVIDMVNFDKTLYDGSLMTMNDKEYTKHYFAGSERICSKIGGGFSLVTDPSGEPVKSISGLDPESKGNNLAEMILRSTNCVKFDKIEMQIEPQLKPATNLENERELDQYFYHPDHLGSSAFITDINGRAIQHLQYLPFGETFIDERTDINYNTPYKFSAKEKDEETQYSYFGARYYDSDLSVWLSVDPLSDLYPNLSPVAYCANNPIMLIDPNGDSTIYVYKGNIIYKSYDNLENAVVDVSWMSESRAAIIKKYADNNQGNPELDGDEINKKFRCMGVVYYTDEFENFYNDNNDDYYDKSKNMKNEHGTFLSYKNGEVRLYKDLNFKGQYNTVDFFGIIDPVVDMKTGKTASELGFGSLDPNLHTHPNSSNGPSPADSKEAKLYYGGHIYDILVNKTEMFFYNKPGTFSLPTHNTFLR